MLRRRADAPSGVVLLLRSLALVCAGVGVAAQSMAQSGGDSAARVLAIEPRLSLEETFTDSVQPGNQQSGADAITRLTAGVGWRGRSGMLRGYADYALTGVVYARHGDFNELRNALNANVAAELIENRLQLLGSAAIARSAISAFGVQPGGAGDNSSNVTETRTLQLSPTLRGPLGPSVRYQASVAHTLTSSADSRLGDSTNTSASVHLEPTERALVSWTLDASSLFSDFKMGRSTRDDRLFGGLSAELADYDLLLSARAGTERTDLISSDRQAYTTWGLGLRWTPSPTTRVEVDFDERFFGRSHQIVAEYRLPRTVFALRSGRTLSTSGNQLVAQRDTFYNLAFNDPRNIALAPDPIVRDVLVRQNLLNASIDPNAVGVVGALRSAATLQDHLELSTMWTGVRQTVMLQLVRSSTRRLDTLSNAVDDLSQVDRIRNNTLALNVTHRLTLMSTLSLHLSAQRSSGGRDDLSSRQTIAELHWQTRLTPDSNASASLRRASYKSGPQSSDETALTASYGVRF